MITFAKFKSSVIEAGKRILKIEGLGGTAATATESMPFGFDGNPIADMIAIHSTTSNNSENVIIGYINKNQLAEVGESRMFSLDSNAALKAFVWCKSDGTIQLNGSDHFAVRFDPLKQSLDNQNTLINAELVKIQTAIGTLGGAYIPATVSTDIATSKSIDVKLK